MVSAFAVLYRVTEIMVSKAMPDLVCSLVPGGKVQPVKRRESVSRRHIKAVHLLKLNCFVFVLIVVFFILAIVSYFEVRKKKSREKMKLSDEFDQNHNVKSTIPLAAMLVCVVVFMMLLVGVVFMVNRKETRPETDNAALASDSLKQEQELSSVSQNEETDYPVGESDLTSDQLDFWNMYKEEPDLNKSLDESGEKYAQKLEELEHGDDEEDLSENGTKTEVILPDGTSQWVMINAYIKKNSYDYTGLVYEEPFMRYYTEGKKVSKLGIFLDESYGSVNLEDVQKSGIDYAIIRLGRRGYSTGVISADTNAYSYMTDASNAGIALGVSFLSQAVTEAEAVEEANAVIATLSESGFTLNYPVFYDMEIVSNDSYRTQNLTRNQLTAIANAFCKTIEDAGYTAAVYGNKYWLLRKLDLTALSNHYICLSQEKDTPDYPYEFTFWEYTKEAAVEGVPSKAALCLSFVDFALR